MEDKKQYNKPNSVICEAIQVPSHKGTCLDELIKPCKVPSDVDLDSLSFLQRTSQRQ